MISEYRKGSEVEIRLIHGEVVVEQEFDADGRPGRWRRMAITVPMVSAGNVSSSVTLSFDLPDAGANNVASSDTWSGIIARMGVTTQGENGEEDEG